MVQVAYEPSVAVLPKTTAFLAVCTSQPYEQTEQKDSKISFEITF